MLPKFLLLLQRVQVHLLQMMTQNLLLRYQPRQPRRHHLLIQNRLHLRHLHYHNRKILMLH
jgi:hypothetical protein